MSGWIRYFTLTALAKTGLSSAVLIWGAVAALAGAGALVFLVFAAFIWLAERYNPLIAALILAGVFALLAVLGAILCLTSHRSAMTQAKLELQSRSSTPWMDPKYLGVGLQVGRAIGWRKLVPIAAVALLAGGLVREWLSSHKPAAAPDTHPGDD
jgi:hypothetical protein